MNLVDKARMALGDMLALWDRVHGQAVLGRPTTNSARKVLEELQAGGWSAIETAPKDGSDIMLGYFLEAGGGGPPVVAFWHSTAQLWCHVHGYLRADGYFSPTHWMPLPSPPAGWDPEVGTLGEPFKKKEAADVSEP